MRNLALGTFVGSLLLALSLAGCTADVETSDDTETTGKITTTNSAATLVVFDDGVQLETGDKPHSAHTGDRVGDRSVLSTDATGLAAVRLAESTALRLGADTKLHIDGITAKQMSLTLSTGRLWHEGSQRPLDYRIVAPSGTVTGKDATFSLACDTSGTCDVIVLSGTLTVTGKGFPAVTVEAYQRVTMTADAQDAHQEIYAVNGTRQDTWIATNLALDRAGTSPQTATPAVDTGAASVIAAASLTGTWAIDTVVTASGNPVQPPGTATHRDWTFGESSCTTTCAMTLTRSFGTIGQEATETVDEHLTYTADGFHAHREYVSDCISADGDVLAAGYFSQTNDYALHVASVELRDGIAVATRLEGTATSRTAFAGAPYADSCYLSSLDPIVASVVGVLVTPAELTALPQPPAAQPAPPAPPAPDRARLTLAHSADTPSVLSSLATVNEIDLSLAKIGTTLALTLILLLIVGYPAQLLNSTISQNYERIFRWSAPLQKRVAAARTRVTIPRKVGIAVGIVVASIIAAFVDPGFGPNLASGRMLASVAVSFVVDSLCAWLLISAVARRSGLARAPIVRFRYGSLVIVAAAVLFSRITGFEPGMVFGLVVGVTLGVTLAKAEDARLTLVGLGYAVAVSIGSWFAFSQLTAVLPAEPGFVGVFVLETLSAFSVAGFASLPIALLPLAVLDGGKLFAWRKLVWAACYAAALFIFLMILLPLPSSWGTVSTPLTLWLSLYIGFGVFAVLFWGYFRLRPTPSTTAAVGLTSTQQTPQSPQATRVPS